MASLTPKVINGKTYYYARECRRVNGKPKIVRTTYLGTLDGIIAAVEKAKQPPEHQAVDVAAFGDVVAVFDMAEQIGLVPLIDGHVGKRRAQGLTVGQYLLLAAINRAVHPTSKAKLGEWYRQTTLPKLIPASAKQLSSQAFWNHMDYLQEGHIEAIERELSQRLIRQFGLSLRTLTYDGTNFFTYINTRNPATLPKRGRNKQKRNDLRQVSLGLLVSTDFHVPLFHKVYEGNVNDATIFKTVSEELAQRYVELARGCEHITLVFDKGNNNDDWTNEEIVLAYRSQHHVEDAFRQMKAPHFLGWSPMFHWTDSKIRVHTFYCVLALTLSSLLQRALHHRGICHSIPRMFELLGGIRETVVIYPRKRGQRKHPTKASFSTLTDEQQTLLDALDLGRYLTR